MAEDKFYSDLISNNPLGSDFNQYQDLKRIIPSAEPIGLNAALNFSGDYQTGPDPGAKDNSGSYADAIVESLNNAEQWAHDPFAYAKTYDYGAGHKNSNFERYYNHPNFKKLGFSPLRDNETIYNANSTWWDDFVRMGSVWTDLAGAGFKSPYDFGSKDTSIDYAKAITIGSTSKEGVGGFVTNLGLSSAFTIGLAAELIAENFAIAGVTALTGGVGAAPAIAASSMMKTGMVTRQLSKLHDIYKTSRQYIEALRNPAKAKEFYDAAKGASLGSKALDFVNPFSRSKEYVTDLYKGANGFKEMNNFVKTRKAFGAFYRDIREINLVTSEALLEGNMAGTDENEQAIDKFYEEFGYMPIGKDAQDINDRSKSIGLATSIANVPVIYFTNKLVFDDLLNGFKPPSIVGESILKGTERKLTKTKDWKLGDDAYGFLAQDVKTRTKDFLFRSPYLPWSKKYILGNLGEGFQEFSQEVTSGAAKLYYHNKFSDPAAAGMYSVLSATGTSISDQFNMKGLEVFASGFFMGSLVQGVGSIATAPMLAPGLYKKYFKSEEFKALKDAKIKAEDIIGKTANDVINANLGNFNENVDAALEIKNLSGKMEEAQQQNNQKAFHDAKNQLDAEHMYLLASQKKMDLVFEHIDDLQSLNNEDLVQAFPSANLSDSTKLRQKLTDFKTRAQAFQYKYDTLTEKYKNPYDYKMYNKDKNPEAYKNELDNMRGWNNAVKDVILSGELYEKNLERIDSVFNDFTTNDIIKNAKSSDFVILMKENDLDYEIDILKNEIPVLSEGSTLHKKQAEEKRKKLEQLLDYKNGIVTYKTSVKRLNKLAAQKQKRSEEITVGNIMREKATDEFVDVISVSEDGATIGFRTQDGGEYEIDAEELEAVYEDKVTEKEAEELNKKLYDIFKSYVKTITDVTDSKLYKEESFNKAFIALRDYFTLENESNLLFNTINVLSDPERFMDYSKRKAELETYKRENFSKIIKNSYTRLSKIYINNIFLNELFDLKIAINPDDAEQVLKRADFEGIIFYDAFTAQPIVETDKRYDKLQKLIVKYQESLKAVEPKKVEKEVKEEAKVKPKKEEPTLKDDIRNKLIEYIKEENKNRKANNELLLSEDLNNADTIKFIAEDDGAQKIINVVKKEPEKKVKTKKKVIDWSPKTPPKELKALAPIYETTWVLTDDEKNYVNEAGELANRVSYLKKDQDESDTGSPAGKERGTIIDAVSREILDNRITIDLDAKGNPTSETIEKVTNYIEKETAKENYIVKFTAKAISQLIVSVREFQEFAKSQGLTLYTDIPPIVSKLAGEYYGGSIDILAKNKAGDFFIIDIKTHNPKYGRRTKPGIKRNGILDQIQLNAYAELFKNLTGITIKGLYVLPLDVEHNGVYNSKGYDTVNDIALELDDKKKSTDIEYMLIPIETKSIYDLDKTVGQNRLKAEVKNDSAKLIAAKYDLLNRYKIDPVLLDTLEADEIIKLYVEEKGKFKGTDKKISKDYAGKLIYVTPGAGKTTLSIDDPNIIDMDQMIVNEMLSRQPQFTKKSGESDQDYIYRYSINDKFGDKNEINAEVLAKAKVLTKAGRTVFTGTLALINDVDVVIIAQENNPRVIKRFGNAKKLELFKKKEEKAVNEYEASGVDGAIDELVDDENLEDIIYDKKKKEEAPPAEVLDPRDAWYEELKNMDLNAFREFKKKMSPIWSNNKSRLPYLKRINMTMKEVDDAMAEKNKELNGKKPKEEPIVNKEVKDVKNKAQDSASNMSSELDIMNKIMNSKASKDEAKNDFLNNMCNGNSL